MEQLPLHLDNFELIHDIQVGDTLINPDDSKATFQKHTNFYLISCFFQSVTSPYPNRESKVV